MMISHVYVVASSTDVAYLAKSQTKDRNESMADLLMVLRQDWMC
jgi:hypothetical protein